MSVTPSTNDRRTVKDAVYDHVRAAVDAVVSTDPDSHVAVDGDEAPDVNPRVFLDGDLQENHRGLHDTHVLAVERDTNDVITDILYGRRYQFTVDCSIADAQMSQADAVANAISTNFNAYDRIRDEQTFVPSGGPPIQNIAVSDGSPIGDNQRFGEVLTLQVEFLDRFYHSEAETPPSTVTEVAFDVEVESGEVESFIVN